MKTSFFDSLVTSLEPHVGTSARKELNALQRLISHFPDQDLVEIEKTVQSMLKESRRTLPVLKERGKKLLNGGTESNGRAESLDEFMKDFASLAPPDLKKFGKTFELELSGSKGEIVADVRKWIESKGLMRPPTAKDKARDAAKPFVEDLPNRMRDIDSSAAETIVAKVDRAFAQLNKDEFQAFAEFLGVPVSGSKQKMKKQLVDFVNRAAMINSQTKF